MYDFNNIVFGGLLIVFIIIVLICMVAAVLKIIGTWKVLEKAGKPGWAALIPYYNSFQLCEITGIRPIWVIASLLVTIATSTLTGIFNAINITPIFTVISTLLSTLSTATNIYFTIILNISLAKSFGKEESFAIGLILLPPVFYLILGTDDSKYLGANPMKDSVYEFINDKVDLSCFGSLTKSSATKETTGKFIKVCPICKNKNDEDSKYCSVCGSKL